MATVMGDEALAKSGNGDGWRNFLDELSEEVLCWLPVKDLLRFRAVSKSWKTLIDSNRFKKKHFQAQQQQRSASLLIWRYSHLGLSEPNLHCLSPQSDNHLLVSLPIDLGQFRDTSTTSTAMSTNQSSHYGNRSSSHYGPYPYGVVNGLVYFTCGTYHGIYNPATQKLLKKIDNIPPRNWYVDLLYKCGVRSDAMFLDQMCAFGFDPKAEDYKFMMCRFASDMKSYPKIKALLAIYSLRSDTWKEVVVDGPSASDIFVLGTSAAFLDGKSYWYAKDSGRKGGRTRLGILQFDFSDETFEVMVLPRELARVQFGFAVQVGESLGLMVTFREHNGKKRGEMWVMDGDEENRFWTRQLTFSLDSGVGWPILLPLPWNDTNAGLKIFANQRGLHPYDDVRLIDPATSSCEHLGLTGLEFSAFNFVESLFSI